MALSLLSGVKENWSGVVGMEGTITTIEYYN
jgi:hypothetical protein